MSRVQLTNNRFIKYLLRIANNKRFKILLSIVTILLVFLFSFLYLKFKLALFPCLNGLLMCASLFLYRSKYRIYSIIFFTSIPTLLSVKSANIPSFVSINLIIYIACIIIETIINRKSLIDIDKKRISIFGVLVLYILISFFINVQTLTLTNTISGVCYLALPILFLVDQKADKKLELLIFVFCLSIILSNLFCFVFIYIFKNYTIEFLNCFISYDYVKEFQIKGDNFRFPGLIGDPNHNSLNIVLATCLVVLYSIKLKNLKNMLIIFAFFMQPFAVIGGSKTYIICIFLLILAFLAYFFYVKKCLLIGLSITFLTFSIVSFMLLRIGVVGTSILRLLNTDNRGGFFESLTTGRLSVWKNYLTSILGNPISCFFGHGVSSSKLYDFHFHNVFIELFWEFGFFGTIVYLLYFYKFYIKPLKDKNKATYFPLLIIVFFGFTLHILHDESVYYCLIISLQLANYYKRRMILKNVNYDIINI